MFEWMSSPPPGASAYDEALLDIWELVGGDVDHHPSELEPRVGEAALSFHSPTAPIVASTEALVLQVVAEKRDCVSACALGEALRGDWQRRWIAALNRGAEPFASTNDGLDLLGVIRPVVGHR